MNQIPQPPDFFLNVPPYKVYEITSSNFADVLRIAFFQGIIDSYCVDCSRTSVFQRETLLPRGIPTLAPPPLGNESNIAMPFEGLGPVKVSNIEKLLKTYSVALFPAGDKYEHRPTELTKYAVTNRMFIVELHCTRNLSHLLRFIFHVQDARITKIGQYPSLADLQGNRIDKYRKALGKQGYAEFSRAIGLSAHGVGVGSFVYLRRIFEDLIETAHVEAARTPDWNEEQFKVSRMDDRILMLRSFLPTFLVENRSIYAILSKGLHDLDDDECLEYFEPVRVAIELILDQKLEQEEKAKKIADTSRAISTIKGKLGKS